MTRGEEAPLIPKQTMYLASLETRKHLPYVAGSVVFIVVTLLMNPWSVGRFIDHAPTFGDEAGDGLLLPITRENASAIFNTVQGALRNKNAQVEPIGVSFIPAYIPEGTLLYHGNGDGQIPEGLEWVAMDHEFSYTFIADRGAPTIGCDDDDVKNGKDGCTGFHFPPGEGHEGPGGPGGPPGGPGGKHPGGPGGPGKPPSHWKPGKRPGPGPPAPSGGSGHTSMLTFRVREPLSRMILLDGSSAAKTTSGEMDQQFLLANMKDIDNPLFGEFEAAERICEWGKSFGLDGFIRIEMGYEAVICDFFDKLELVSNITVDWANNTLNLPIKLSDESLNEEYTDLFKSISAMEGYDQIRAGNVHDKRDGRILLDFSKFQTMLNRTYVGTDPYTRRIYNVSSDLREGIRDDLARVLKPGTNPYQSTNWQLMTTEIVDKFSPILKLINQTLSSDEATDLEKAKNITVFTTNTVRRFTQWSGADVSMESNLERAKLLAVKEYAHPLEPVASASDALIYSSLHKVTEMIVDAVFESFIVSRTIINGYFLKEDIDFSPLEKLQSDMIDLLNTLRWDSTFYRCSETCAWDEVCYTPSWGPSPLGWGQFGTYEDADGKRRIEPDLRCVSYKTILGHGGRPF